MQSPMIEQTIAAGRQSRAAAGVTAADFSAGNDAQRHARQPPAECC